MTALVCKDARSDPASGSEKPWHHTTSPRRILGRWKFLCSSLARLISVGPAWLLPTKRESIPGRPSLAYSSYQMTCCNSERPRPPYSTGQSMPAQPPSHCLRCHAKSNSRVALLSRGRGSVGPFSLIHVRTSSRKAASLGETSRFTLISCTRPQRTLLAPAPDHRRSDTMVTRSSERLAQFPLRRNRLERQDRALRLAELGHDGSPTVGV